MTYEHICGIATQLSTNVNMSVHMHVCMAVAADIKFSMAVLMHGMYT